MLNLARTLLADDHDIFLDGLEQTLSEVNGLEIIGRATRGIDVIHKLERLSVDLLILDINIPQKNGIEILEYIQNLNLNIKIVVLTYYNDYALIKKVLGLGTMAYVLKDSGKTDLINAVHHVLNGKKYMSPEVYEIIKMREDKIDPYDDFVMVHNLTKREIEILTEIAKELSTTEIANKLYISEYTVETYRKNIIRKLGAKNIAALVNFAHKWKLV